MKRRKNNSTIGVIQTIEHIEAELLKLKKTLIEAEPLPKKGIRASQSVREYEFCSMWKDRKDMEVLSTIESLSKLRREQWGKF